MNQTTIEDGGVRPEIDFSNAVRGLHYIHPGSKVSLPGVDQIVSDNLSREIEPDQAPR